MKFAALIRVSTEEQAEQNLSVPAQRSRILSYCHAKGWHIEDYYIDEGYSGKNLDRPAVQRLIADAGKKKFDGVIVWKLDRLSRRQQHVMHLIEDVFLANDIAFTSVTENIDTSTPAGRAMIGVLAVFAQLERETIVERTKMGKQEAAVQGRFGGGLPYGYDYDKKTKQLVINPLQAEAVRAIYGLYLTGQYGFQLLADEMTRRGYTSQKTTSMNKYQIKNILSSPFVAGLVKHLDHLYTGQHEAIIPIEKWEQTQKMLTARHAPRQVKDAMNLLSGLIWCGKCGARMRFKSRTWKSSHSSGTAYYYVCYGRMGYKNIAPKYCNNSFHPACDINNQVVKKLREYKFNIDEVKSVIAKTSKPVENSMTLKTVLCELSKINNQIEKWATAFESGLIQPDVIVSRMNSLAKRKKALEANLNQLRQQINTLDVQCVQANAVLEILDNIPEYWDDMTIDEKRTTLFGLVKRVTVAEDGKALIELDL